MLKWKKKKRPWGLVRAHVAGVGQRLKSHAGELKPFLEKHSDDVTTACILVVGYYGVKAALQHLPPPLLFAVSLLGGVILGRWTRQRTRGLWITLLRKLL